MPPLDITPTWFLPYKSLPVAPDGCHVVNLVKGVPCKLPKHYIATATAVKMGEVISAERAGKLLSGDGRQRLAKILASIEKMDDDELRRFVKMAGLDAFEGKTTQQIELLSRQQILDAITKEEDLEDTEEAVAYFADAEEKRQAKEKADADLAQADADAALAAAADKDKGDAAAAGSGASASADALQARALELAKRKMPQLLELVKTLGIAEDPKKPWQQTKKDDLVQLLASLDVPQAIAKVDAFLKQA